MAFKFDAISTTPFMIPGQLMKHVDHMPSFNCVMYDADTKTDDRIQVQRVTVNGNEDALRFRFRSEVGGIFGKIANPWWSKVPFVSAVEEYSDYYVYLTASGKFFIKSAANTVGTGIYRLDGDKAEHRVLDIIAGAIKCYASIKQLPQMAQLADDIYNGKSAVTLVPGYSLPSTDAVEAQQERSWTSIIAQMAQNGFGDAYSR